MSNTAATIKEFWEELEEMDAEDACEFIEDETKTKPELLLLDEPTRLLVQPRELRIDVDGLHRESGRLGTRAPCVGQCMVEALGVRVRAETERAAGSR